MQQGIYCNQFRPPKMIHYSTYMIITVSNTHRISAARKEKGWGLHFFHQIEPNWPLPYSTVPVPRLRKARPAGWVTYCSICASTMSRAQNRAGKGSILLWRQFTLPIFLLFIYANTQRKLPPLRTNRPDSNRGTTKYMYRESGTIISGLPPYIFTIWSQI